MLFSPVLPQADHFWLEPHIALYSANERQELVGVCHFHLHIIPFFFTLPLWALVIVPTLVSAEVSEKREAKQRALAAGVLACHCKSSQRWHAMEATGQLINTRLCSETLDYVSPSLWRRLLSLDGTYWWGETGRGGNCSLADSKTPELMQVYLARHTKSTRSQLGMIKIAICCPFRDIMLSIKHLIHWLSSTQAGSPMAQGLLTLTSAVTMLG